MSAWTRLLSYRRLIHMDVAPSCIEVTQSIALNMVEITNEQVQRSQLESNFYLPWSTDPSCFQVLALGGDLKFAFSPQYATMLCKFTRDGDAYLFLSEFEEVCSMM